jgi:hypothetical protein
VFFISVSASNIISQLIFNLGLSLRRNLRKTAVRTRNLYNQKSVTEASTSRSKRLSGRKTKQEVSKLLEAAALPSYDNPSLIDTEHLIEDHPNPEPRCSHAQDLNYEAKYSEILDKYRVSNNNCYSWQKKKLHKIFKTVNCTYFGFFY